MKLVYFALQALSRFCYFCSLLEYWLSVEVEVLHSHFEFLLFLIILLRETTAAVQAIN